MKTGSIVAFAAIGIAVGLLFTTKKGAELRHDLSDAAGEWKHKLNRASRKAVNELSDLKNVVSKEISGLGSDARRRILEILDEGQDTGRRVKSKVKSELS